MRIKLKNNNERGITLIALIITIIIMLILVAVSVRILINSNIIGIAEEAANKTKTAYEEENDAMNSIKVGDKTLNEYIEATKPLPEKQLPEIKTGERAASNSTYTDSNGKTAVIPAGFTVSGIKNETADETTIEGGLVIYLIPEGTTVNWTDATEVANAQKTYDQFVWIPISHTQINDMYICQGKTSDNGACTIEVKEGVAKCTNAQHSSVENGVNKNTLMAGYLYRNTAMTTRAETYTEGSSNREPDTVSKYDGNSTYLGILSAILEPNATEANKVYTSEANFKAKLQEEYNEVVKSVYLNEGFYVGRYETSNMTKTSGTAVKVVKETKEGINSISWYYMYAQQVKYVENKNLDINSVGSTMIQGAAYDQVMKFVNTEDYDVTTAGNVGHDFNSVYNTGSQSTDQTKNIYDLEGNVSAWTTEALDTGYRVGRGGYYGVSSSASYRYGYDDPSNSYDDLGSLCQLYVK